MSGCYDTAGKTEILATTDPMILRGHLESLGMDGAEFCRRYIQNWLQGGTIPERSARRIFAAADKILKAGIEKTHQGGAE